MRIDIRDNEQKITEIQYGDSLSEFIIIGNDSIEITPDCYIFSYNVDNLIKALQKAREILHEED